MRRSKDILGFSIILADNLRCAETSGDELIRREMFHKIALKQTAIFITPKQCIKSDMPLF